MPKRKIKGESQKKKNNILSMAKRRGNKHTQKKISNWKMSFPVSNSSNSCHFSPAVMQNDFCVIFHFFFSFSFRCYCGGFKILRTPVISSMQCHYDKLFISFSAACFCPCNEFKLALIDPLFFNSQQMICC